jgi:hypothetical protein
MDRTFEEHNASVLALASQLNPLLQPHEIGIGVSALLLLISTALRLGFNDFNRPNWADDFAELSVLILNDIASTTTMAASTSRPS